MPQTQLLEVPQVRLSISGAKSGTNPETQYWTLKVNPSRPRICALTILEFPGFVRLEIPKPWKIKQIPSPEEFQNCATPSTVGSVSFFGGAPSTEQPELVMKFLTVLGAPLKLIFPAHTAEALLMFVSP